MTDRDYSQISQNLLALFGSGIPGSSACVFSVDLTLEETSLVAAQLAEALPERTWLFLEGNLGAGKTTFVQNLLDDQGAQSPTYSIVNVSESSGTLASRFHKIFHLDLYRLKAIDELLYLGLDTEIDSKSLVIVEWPFLFSHTDWQNFAKVSNLAIPKQVLVVEIVSAHDGWRTYSFSLESFPVVRKPNNH